MLIYGGKKMKNYYFMKGYDWVTEGMCPFLLSLA
jgi:hypothetical protein